CKDCENAFDIQQAFTDDALTECPQCGGTLRKRYGSVGVVFKGSGFYRNDSRSGAKKPAAAGAATGGSSSASGSASSDSSSSSSSTAGSSSGSGSTGSSTEAASA